MQEGKDSRKNLQTLYSFSKKISIIASAKPAAAQRTMLLEKMVEKILLHDYSILHLLDILPEQISELDVSLIASAARNIMDTANIYFYISQRGIDAAELNFRAEIMTLNELFNEMDITKKLGFSQECIHTQINRDFFKTAEIRFQQFPQFMQLTPDKKSYILSGRKAAFQMESPHILQSQMESAIYNLLSNSVHGISLGLGSNSVNRTPYFNSFFSADRLLVIALQTSCLYTAHVIKDYLNLRKSLYSLLTLEEKKLLNSYQSSQDLVQYICVLKQEYERDIF